MKKHILQIVAIMCIAVLLAGCSTDATEATTEPTEETVPNTYTHYLSGNGDTITVSLDTTGGYEISSDKQFVISCDGEEVSIGRFVNTGYYESFVQQCEDYDTSVLLDSGETDGNLWLFFTYTPSNSYNFVIKIGDSNTALLLLNSISEESARECFERVSVWEEVQ